ncbi:MAG TPA: RNA polymerase sigma factor [Steroidobacteraceae bacterium]
MPTAVAATAPEDDDVVELLRSSGREPAFALLLPRYEHKVYRLCCALLRDPSQAQDAAQESLVRIWKGLPSYDGRASLSSWIYAITRNRCLTALERRRTELRAGAHDLALDPCMPMYDADDDGEHEQRSAQLRELIELLPERQRRTLVLFYFEDRSVAEVAQRLGCPEGTVKTNLHRARATLTGLLRQRGLDDRRHWLEDGS